jgi:hypothetical protein
MTDSTTPHTWMTRLPRQARPQAHGAVQSII